ncbi:hypothetical protein ACEPAI_6758 [Sanghuangporus weigelae]
MPADNEDRPRTPEKSVPPAEHQRGTKETPAKPRSIHSSSYREGTLDERRFTVLEELSFAIPEVPLILFLESLLPPLNNGFDIDAILESLKDQVIIAANGRWAAFPQDPRSLKGENTIFSPLEDIFSKVVETAIQQASALNPTFVLRLLPNAVPESERGSTTRPDGFAVVKEAEDRNQEGNAVVYRWYDIALTCEFKLLDTDAKRDDNVTKIVYSMQHTMTLDLCKRFTFGITIEDTNMRLWFSSRAVMAVSEPFNFITQPELLIHVFLSLAFASKTELGWDPTIRVVDPDASKRVYQIEVDGTWYEVLEVLSDFGADAVISRATRVYKVKSLDTGKTYVLKDVWVEDDRDLEHEIYNKILAAVEKTCGKEIRKLVASHLLTPFAYWVVPIDGQKDHTKDVMMRGSDLSFEKSFKLSVSKSADREISKSIAPMQSTDREVYDEQNAHLGTRAPPEEPRSELRHRIHYRIVFEETATPVWAVTRLSDAFIVLRDCVTALKYIHKSGYVHRDISAGNVFYYEGRGLIGDLEYAKEMATDGTHQMRTGTPDFMAIEVMRQEYLYQPQQDSSQIRKGNTDERFRDERLQEYLKAMRNVPKLPFVQNEGHDVESSWWIAIYILFFNADETLSKEEIKNCRHSRQVWTQRIFPGALNIAAREHFFRLKAHAVDGVAWLPSSYELAVASLLILRDVLNACYVAFEKDFPNLNIEAFSELHDEAISGFNACVKHTSGIKIASYKVLGRRHQQKLSQPVFTPPPSDTAEPAPNVPGQTSPTQQRTLKDVPENPQ